MGTQELSLLNCSADFLQSVKDKEELDGQALAAAFQSGVEVAYKAVMKPVEGTILTVSRGAAIGAKKKAESTNDAVEVMRAALEGAKTALAEDSRYVASLERSWRGRLWWSRVGLHL